jgi:hypothetical protein
MLHLTHKGFEELELGEIGGEEKKNEKETARPGRGCE